MTQGVWNEPRDSLKKKPWVIVYESLSHYGRLINPSVGVADTHTHTRHTAHSTQHTAHTHTHTSRHIHNSSFFADNPPLVLKGAINLRLHFGGLNRLLYAKPNSVQPVFVWLDGYTPKTSNGKLMPHMKILSFLASWKLLSSLQMYVMCFFSQKQTNKPKQNKKQLVSLCVMSCFSYIYIYKGHLGPPVPLPGRYIGP